MRLEKNLPSKAGINARSRLYRMTPNGMKSKSSGRGVRAKMKMATEPYFLKSFVMKSIFFLYLSLITFLPPTPRR